MAYNFIFKLKSKGFLLFTMFFMVLAAVEMEIFVYYNDLGHFNVFLTFFTVFFGFPIIWLYAKIYHNEMNKLFLTPTEWNDKNNHKNNLSYSTFDRPPSLYDLIEVKNDENSIIELKSKFYQYVQNRNVIFVAIAAWIIPYALFLVEIINTGTVTHNGILLDTDLRDNYNLLAYELFFSFIAFTSFSFQVLLIGTTILSLRFLATLDQRQKIIQLSKLHDMALNLQNDYTPNEAILLKDYTKFSYRMFRKNAKCVSNLAMRVTILGTVSFVLFNIFLYQAITASLEQGNYLSVGIAITADILYLISLVFLFFYPQKAVNKWLVNAKKSLITILEELYQERLIEYFKISKQSASKETRNDLVSEISFLDSQIEYTEKLLTWPFDYRQLFAAIIAIGTSGLSVIIPLAYQAFNL